MFVHAYSYEDLNESEDGPASGDSSKEGAGSPPPLPTDMRQISQDFSELSTQLTGVARDLQEEMLPGSSEDWPGPPGTTSRPAKEPPEDGTSEGDEQDATEAWRLHQKHVFVLSEAGKPVYSRHGSEEALSSTMGVMVALVSFLEADKNAIRSIHAGELPEEGSRESSTGQGYFRAGFGSPQTRRGMCCARRSVLYPSEPQGPHPNIG